MKKKAYTPEQIVKLLRQVEAGLADGKTVEETCRALGIGDSTYHRWRNQYGGMKTDEVHRLKELEKENDRLKRIVADLSLDNADPQGGRPGKLTGPARCREVVGRVCREMDLRSVGSARPSACPGA